MIIAAHIGFHATEAAQLHASLGKSGRLFRREGIALPSLDTCRDVVIQTMKKLRGETASPETEEMLLAALLGTDDPQRLILSQDQFICAVSQIFAGGAFYGRAAEKVDWLRKCFPSHEIELFLAVRNPATLIPALMTLPKNGIAYDALLQGVDPDSLRWFATIAAIRDAHPDLPITAWAYEDLPLIWTQILREVAGLAPMSGVFGNFDILRQIMNPEGIARLKAYLREHKLDTDIQLRRVIAAFLDKYAIADAIVEEIDLPGWDATRVEHLTETYEDDLIEIGRIPGVTLVTP